MLSVNEFCRVYKIGRTFAYELLANGKLSAVKANRRTLIPREAAEAWAASLVLYGKPDAAND